MGTAVRVCRICGLTVVALAFFVLGFALRANLDVLRLPQTETDFGITNPIQMRLDTFNISDESIMSAYEALIFIDEAIYSHQFYIDQPELQNAGTGDTAFNEKIIKQYRRLRKLIEQNK